MPHPTILPSPPRRLVSLDVLRGLAILLMIGSAMLPKTLPNWVDHGYQPHYRPDATGEWVSTLVNGVPPVDVRWKSFTWVDLVFPMFLFAMGTAIPLAMSGRLDRGQTRFAALRGIAGRTLTLAAFAVIVTQLSTWQLSWPAGSPDAARGRALLGFVGAFLFFLRWPRDARASVVVASRILGVGIVLGLIVAGVRYGAPFAWRESDIIILVLAHTYLIAAGLWVVTRSWGAWRLAAIAPLLLLAHYLQFASPAFADWRWLGDRPLAIAPATTDLSRALELSRWLPAAWSPQVRTLFDFSPFWHATWCKFLWCVVPGTIVGDRLVRRGDEDATTAARLPRRTVLALSLAIVGAACVGLRHYGFPTLGLGGAFRTPWLALTLTLPLAAALLGVVLARSNDPTHRWLVVVGTGTLVIGLLLSCLPVAGAREGFFEGGISKGSPATLSYYVTSVGLCVVLLLGLLVAIDGDPRRRDASPGVIEANGQNPLLAYFLAHSTIGAFLTLSPFAAMNRAIDANVWLDTGVGIAKTLLIALLVWTLTRRRIFWRA